MNVTHSTKQAKINTHKNVYQCSICNRVFNWNKDSSWHGSYKQLEEETSKVRYYCCDECKDKDKQSC